ncbi:hypothetical protein Taro_037002 [Colocasia esculenta]|uniref:Peroxidase n=1 Tax=Colocasia esculenta TaxID=4460 RepID=A0A843W9Y4_COLES|nr:hypothetical protein [Colocasia esculenta]
MARYVLLVLLAALPALCMAQLKIGFYDQTCPPAERLVRQAVASAVASNPGIAAGLIRMHFHDCFVRGCDGSVLLDGTPGNLAEKDAIPNLSLRGWEVIDAAKSAIEAACPGVVSCADILAFASRDSADLAGNITYKVPAGRRDGRVSIQAEALTNLPAPFLNASGLIANFARKNLTAAEMVTLSGAHSIGRAHCGAFTNRLYNTTTGAVQIDPTLSLSYGELLQSKCPASSTPTTPITARLDIITADVLDNKYYVALQQQLGLLTSDQALTTDPALKAEVDENAGRPNGWATKFHRATVKMGAIEVLTGSQGEIRRNCRVVNSRRLGFEAERSAGFLRGVASF